MTDNLYTQSDLEALRERCAKVAEKWGNDLDRAGAQFDKDGDIYAQAGIAFTITRDIRALPITPHTEEGVPDWDDLRGVAPDATGDLSSEAFIRKQRDEWDD